MQEEMLFANPDWIQPEQQEQEENRNVEQIQVETMYVWEAVYEDGTTLPEVGRDGVSGEVVKHGFAEVDLARCSAFVLHSVVPECRDILVKIDAASGQRPIFFRRYQAEYDFETGETRRLEPIHCIGWQRTVHGVNVSHYTFIFPDGSLLLSDEHNAV